MSEGTFKPLAFFPAGAQENARVGARRPQLGCFLVTGLGQVLFHSFLSLALVLCAGRGPGVRPWRQAWRAHRLGEGTAVKPTRKALTPRSRVGRLSAKARVKTARH